MRGGADYHTLGDDLAYLGGRRVAARKSDKRPAKTYAFPAPVGGWVTNQNLAAQLPNTATVMDNVFPTETSVRGRGGSTKAATIGSSAVTALFAYYGSTVADNAFFAADASNIYNITSFDPDTAPSADVSSLTGGDWSAVQMTTSGGEYLICVNGADTARTYDGTSWASSTISFSGSYSGVASSDIASIFKHKGRVFLVEKDSSRCFFLQVDSIAGDIGTDAGTGALELGAIFQRGGSLLFGATWSLDAGDGVDDKAVFVSSLGEMAIYEGSDPSSSSDWSLIGRFDISAPLGRDAVIQAGGDLIIATYEGLVPVSQALNRDVAALSLGAISRAIEPDWRRQVQKHRDASSPQPWQFLKWPSMDMGLVTLPNSDTDEQYVVNLKTGAWCRYTGWTIEKTGLFEDWGYYGDSSGSIWKMELGGADQGETNILHRVRYAWHHLKSLAQHKQAQLARASFLALADFEAKLSVGADYDNDFPAQPDSVSNAAPVAALWDSGVWDSSLWDVTSGVVADAITVTTRWRSVAANGFILAPELQVVSGGARTPDWNLIQYDLTYEEGAAVV